MYFLYTSLLIRLTHRGERYRIILYRVINTPYLLFSYPSLQPFRPGLKTQVVIDSLKPP